MTDWINKFRELRNAEPLAAKIGADFCGMNPQHMVRSAYRSSVGIALNSAVMRARDRVTLVYGVSPDRDGPGLVGSAEAS